MVGLAVAAVSAAAPDAFALTNKTAPEVINVPASQSPITIIVNPESTAVTEKSPQYIDDAIGLLELVVGIFALVVAILGLFGFLEIRKWKEQRKEFQEQINSAEQKIKDFDNKINEAKQKVEDAENMAKEAERQAEKSKKLATEIENIFKRIIISKEQIERIRIEAQEKMSGVVLPPITEEPSEEIKSKLDEFAERIEILETVGVNLNAEDFFKIAKNYYYKENYKESLQAIDKSIKINPKNASAWTGKGAALERLNRPEVALEAYDEAIKLEPDYALARYNKGIALGKLKKHNEALKAFDKAIDLKPDFAKAWDNKGIALGKLERYEEALKAFDKAIELKPDFAEAWDNKGFALNNLERHEEALKAHDMAIKLKPDLANAYFNRACVYALIGDKENALKDLAKAIELDGKCKEKARTDKDFSSLRDDPDFKALIG